MFHRLQPWLLAVALLRLPCAAADAVTPTPGTDHWAYQPIQAGTPPNIAGVPHPVDAFIRSTLARSGLTPAPEADRRTLLRRVTFDLTGLPPTPEESGRFLEDASPDAYERVVDRLLASPHYGERWARHWMDAVHFAETHGHDQDRIRTNAWPYRDYLIASFNADKPYSRFIREQVAADVLYPSDPQSVVALGFLAAGPWDESSLRDIREDTLDRQIARYLDRDDMVTTVMSVVASTTVHCARCHDHKFDPIPQRDYYALQAVFAGVDRAERRYDPDPAVQRHRRDLEERLRRIDSRDPSFLMSPAAAASVARWERDRRNSLANWTVLPPRALRSESGSILTHASDDSVVASGPRPERDTYVVTAAAPESEVTALRLEVISDERLPHKGPGRADNGNLHLSEVRVLVSGPDGLSPTNLPLSRATADFNQEGWSVDRAIDHSETTAWGIHPREGESHRAIFGLETPRRIPAGSNLTIELHQRHGGGHLIGRFRLATTDTPEPAVDLPPAIEGILSRSPGGRSREEQIQLAAWVLREELEAERATLPPPARVYAAASDFEPDGGLKPSRGPRQVSVLRRGEITQPLEPAAAGALSCISTLPSRFDLARFAEEGPRRAALAEWLTADANPLPWRSIVNRVWALHFGTGLVDTPNDFGRMGSKPSHPELLDWLAAWFREDARGSWKQLHRLLVTSATYRQSCLPEATSVPTGAAMDPSNRWYSHAHRTRLDAECIHDAVLQFSGRLEGRMGGPGDRQFGLQPGIHVTPRVDYSAFDVDSPAAARRSVYRFLFRTLPDPFMAALDCPAGDQLTALRNNTVTVQQALALWNDRFIVRQAEHIAARLNRDAASDPERVRLACELVWGRPPTRDEEPLLGDHVRKHGLASLCRLLLNSNEFIFLN